MANESGGTAQDRYVVISADTHGGGDLLDYRAYLEPQWLEEFDAWVAQYSSPYDDLVHATAERNWNSERRLADLDADGIVAEIVFPNTVPPFFNTISGFATLPWTREDFERRCAGAKAHNRWLVDFCADYPDQRAGLGQIFVNDLDDALEDVRWIKEHGLRGGVLLPNIPPDAHWVEHHLYDPYWEPLWALCEELQVPVNAHGGTGVPDFGKVPAAPLLYIAEATFYAQRPFLHLLLSGVFQRHPNLTFVMTEMGAGWLPAVLRRLDGTLERIRKTGSQGELRFGDESKLEKSATEYFRQNCYMAISQPKPSDVEAIETLGIDRCMWGSDYPHDEGTHPFTREHLRQLFSDRDEAWMRTFLAGTAAKVYDFDLDALAPIAATYGPEVAEITKPLVDLPPDANEALLAGASLLFKG